jgi:hypothetical protein
VTERELQIGGHNAQGLIYSGSGSPISMSFLMLSFQIN